MKIPVMEVEIAEEKDNLLKLKLKGSRTTYAVLLAKYLLDNPEVEFAAWTIDHPEYDYAYLVVRAKDPRKALKDTASQLVKICENLEKSLEQELKKVSSRASKR